MQADEAAAEPEEADEPIVQAANGMNMSESTLEESAFTSLIAISSPVRSVIFSKEASNPITSYFSSEAEMADEGEPDGEDKAESEGPKVSCNFVH